jgi:NAD(P)-dependent dehydrogenase (short-subunit alcohol dehydrogenase family)
MPVALITGASTGIGASTALRLAAKGWTVLAGVRDPAAGERLKEQAAGPGQVLPLALDVTSAAQIAAAAEFVRLHTAADERSPGGRLDALVNNAGIGLGGPLEILPLEDLRRQFEVNVFGQVAVTSALLGALRAASGRIVFLSSVGGRVAVPFNGPYSASKYALEAIGDALRGELYSSHVKVVLVEPGSVKTPIWDKTKAEVGRVQIPPQLEAEYGEVVLAAEKLISDTAARAIPPEQVAATIELALTARRPRARYIVGRDAKGMILARTILPTAVFDRIIRRALGI